MLHESICTFPLGQSRNIVSKDAREIQSSLIHFCVKIKFLKIKQKMHLFIVCFIPAVSIALPSSARPSRFDCVGVRGERARRADIPMPLRPRSPQSTYICMHIYINTHAHTAVNARVRDFMQQYLDPRATHALIAAISCGPSRRRRRSLAARRRGRVGRGAMETEIGIGDEGKEECDYLELGTDRS